MPEDIFPTTAEHVIAAADAVLMEPHGCDLSFVALFMDVPVASAESALGMAEALGLIACDSNGAHHPCKPFASYLATARDAQKAAVLRILLEEYEPYKAFKYRLWVTGLASVAAQQVKVIFHLNRHRDEIMNTLVSLGTYSQSLVSEGAGVFRAADFAQQADVLPVMAEIAARRSQVESLVRSMLGESAAGWIDCDNVLFPLVTAYQKLSPENEPRTPILYAGNATESFLTQLGAYKGINLTGKTGINAKAEGLGGQLCTKHKNMLKYLGHVRNATDHGSDPEIGASWDISRETAIQYVHVAISTIRSLCLAALKNQYVL